MSDIISANIILKSEIMDKERSFVMVKPDGVKRGLTDEIIKRLEDAGLTIVARKDMTADQAIVSKHYPVDNREYVLGLGHVDTSNMTPEEVEAVYSKNRGIIESLHKYIQSGPVVPMIIEGPEGTVKKIRELTGKTNPIDAAPGTIRGDFGDDSYAAADDENRSVRNIVHASGEVDEVEAEIAIWFPEKS